MNGSTVIIVFLLTFGHLLFPPRNTNSQNSNKLLQFPLEVCVIGVHWIDINVFLETPVINLTDVYKLIVLISVNNITLPHSSTYTCRMQSKCFFFSNNKSFLWVQFCRWLYQRDASKAIFWKNCSQVALQADQEFFLFWSRMTDEQSSIKSQCHNWPLVFKSS